MSRIMAHRGARNLWPENSLLGFRQALSHGFTAIEFDVHLSDAGELVVIHDPTLERTTDGRGAVRDLTPETRRDLRLRGQDGRMIEECPPLLSEVLALFVDFPEAEPWVELKCDAEGHTSPDLVIGARDALRAAGLQHRAAMHSFDIEVVRQIRDHAPEMKRLVSVNAAWAERQGGIAAMLAGVEGLVDIVGIHHELFEAEFDTIRALRPLSACSVWTINSPDLMRTWIARGPGFLVSDDPVLLAGLIEEMAA